jgi:hypothetical protein
MNSIHATDEKVERHALSASTPFGIPAANAAGELYPSLRI